MSGIALSHFVEIARLGTDGEVRMDSSRPNVLINKGMLEHRLGTMLGMGDATTRNDRNAEAVTRFREALTRRFGAETAEKALGLANYAEGTALTGRVIVDAHRHALETEHGNRLGNAAALEKAWIADEDDNVVDAFKTRFAENLKVSTRYFRDDFHGKTALAEMTEDQVRTLAESGKLEESNHARKALSDAMQSVLVSIANKEKPDVLLGKLMAARDAEKVLVDIEKEADNHVNRGRLKTQVATFDALEKLDSRYSEFIHDMQRRGLADTSSLRALYAGAEEILNKPDATTRQKQEAQALKNQCEALIDDVVAATRPHTQSKEGDLDRLKDAGTVDTKRQTQASTGLTNAYQQWSVDTADCKTFLNDYVAFHKDDRREWDTPRLSQQLEDSVKQSAIGNDIPVPEAIRSYRAGIEEDDGLSRDLKAKLMRTLDGVEAEHQLVADLQLNRRTQRLDPDEVWRLVVPGNDQQRKLASKWDIEQQVSGSYASMCRGMSEALKQSGSPNATSEDLRRIQEIAVQNNVRREDDMALRAGYREGNATVELTLGKNLTPDGADEIRAYIGNDPDRMWLNGSKVSHDTVTLKSWVGTGIDEGPKRANGILNEFAERLSQGGDRVELVADTIQQLSRSILFTDGATESVVTLMTNRLLLSIGERPAILDDPARMIGCSRAEFADAIRAGQKQVGQYVN